MMNQEIKTKGEMMLEKAEKISSFWAFKEEPLSKDKQLLLFDNVQFIYELALAQLELKSLGVNFEVTNGLREFKLLKEPEDVETLKRKLAYFKLIKGEYTNYFYIYLMAKLVAVSDNIRRKKDFTKSFKKNLDLMILSVKDYVDIVKELNLKLGKIDIKVGDFRNLPLEDNSIDGIVTSPPYSIALDYVSNDAHCPKNIRI